MSKFKVYLNTSVQAETMKEAVQQLAAELTSLSGDPEALLNLEAGIPVRLSWETDSAGIVGTYKDASRLELA